MLKSSFNILLIHFGRNKRDPPPQVHHLFLEPVTFDRSWWKKHLLGLCGRGRP